MAFFRKKEKEIFDQIGIDKYGDVILKVKDKSMVYCVLNFNSKHIKSILLNNSNMRSEFIHFLLDLCDISDFKVFIKDNNNPFYADFDNKFSTCFEYDTFDKKHIVVDDVPLAHSIITALVGNAKISIDDDVIIKKPDYTFYREYAKATNRLFEKSVNSTDFIDISKIKTNKLKSTKLNKEEYIFLDFTALTRNADDFLALFKDATDNIHLVPIIPKDPYVLGLRSINSLQVTGVSPNVLKNALNDIDLDSHTELYLLNDILKNSSYSIKSMFFQGICDNNSKAHLWKPIDAYLNIINSESGYSEIFNAPIDLAFGLAHIDDVEIYCKSLNVKTSITIPIDEQLYV
ncbi:MAG: hypothetical protein K0B02_01365 [DPANN group archaeon]|nr:hypothetical protein [DPANN group archaeon]